MRHKRIFGVLVTMSATDRLHQIIDALPPHQVHALLTFPGHPQPLGDNEFTRLPAELPDDEIDAETAARLLAAEAEAGDCISHDEMKRRLGL